MSDGLGLGRGGHDLGAVNELTLGEAEDGHLAEGSLERGSHPSLVVCCIGVVLATLQLNKLEGVKARTSERLPLASSARVTRELRVGLEAKLAAERGLDLALVASGAGEEGAAELRLDEKLGVEFARGGVEGRSRDGGVDNVGSGDGVRGEQSDNLSGGEAASVSKASENAVNGVEGLGDGPVGSGHRRVLAADEDVELRSTGAVRDTDGARKLDAVGVVSVVL